MSSQLQPVMSGLCLCLFLRFVYCFSIVLFLIRKTLQASINVPSKKALKQVGNNSGASVGQHIPPNSMPLFFENQWQHQNAWDIGLDLSRKTSLDRRRLISFSHWYTIAKFLFPPKYQTASILK
ncbi:hypothetical protein BX661DRAFT_30258 [Kickxella alabastrina]|uniref:uncharacterized protein n=1 Tax=Kickxella alabastrina TaxID=61397 RepID=UPI00221FB37E|nr:uncharacterized protein BX661DRAFT_30258 [Kickxella alabastrina]KAI7826770.1 hypothetical protein BX661DRAFT_30258 [Kickxella alabastrina]